jgi:flagellar protein FliS
MYNPYQKASNAYKTIDLQSRIEAATPHELINLLFQGARTNIATAIGCLQRNQIKEKGEHLSKAIGIIDGLKSSLNMQQGGKVAEDLLALYNQVQHLIYKANIQNSAELLTRSNEILAGVHEAWMTIKPDV